MKTTLYLLAILALYGLAGSMDYQDQAYENQLVLVQDCDTDYDCMIKNPQIEED